MQTLLKRKLVLGTIVVATAAFAGGAYAATQNSTNPRQAFLNDVAKRLNVTPQKLQEAMKGAFLDQLQAAVKAGRLTQAQANAIEQRMQQQGFPPLGPIRPGPSSPLHFAGHAGPIPAAASYLGLTDRQLFDELSSGKSLAQIAAQRGKSVSGLKAAMTASIRSRLDKLVAAKVITSAQETKVLSRLSSHLDQLINHTGGRFGPGMGGHFGPGGPGGPGAPGGQAGPAFRFHRMFGAGAVPARPPGVPTGPFA